MHRAARHVWNRCCRHRGRKRICSVDGMKKMHAKCHYFVGRLGGKGHAGLLATYSASAKCKDTTKTCAETCPQSGPCKKNRVVTCDRKASVLIRPEPAVSSELPCSAAAVAAADALTVYMACMPPSVWAAV